MVVDRVAAAIGLSTTPFPGPELFWGIRKLLEAIATRRPLVAIVDDIHVAAPTFLELLDHLLESVHGSPILLLTTARRELLETRTEWAEAHEYDQMILDPLSADESDSIVDAPAGRARSVRSASGSPPPPRATRSTSSRSPRCCIETGAIRQEGDHWVAAGTSSEIDIPPTIQALVAARARCPATRRSARSSIRHRSSGWASPSRRWRQPRSEETAVDGARPSRDR